MAYTFEIVRKNDQTVSEWSGGTTTQLAIYPEDAEYANRNFIWRISSAAVEADESVFTSLPGVSRIIMVIEGEMRLIHEGHHEVLMKPFEQDSFSGDWTTRSFGRVRDFNLMLKEGCTGSLKAITVEVDEIFETLEFHQTDFKNFSRAAAAYYCIGGGLDISIGRNEKVFLNDGDMFIINLSSSSILNLGIKRRDAAIANVIRAVVFY